MRALARDPVAEAMLGSNACEAAITSATMAS